MSRLDQVADDVSELKVMVGKIITTLDHQQKQDEGRDKAIGALEKKMATALIPILFTKWAVALAGGAAVLVSFVKLFAH